MNIQTIKPITKITTEGLIHLDILQIERNAAVPVGNSETFTWRRGSSTVGIV